MYSPITVYKSRQTIKCVWLPPNVPLLFVSGTSYVLYAAIQLCANGMFHLYRVCTQAACTGVSGYIMFTAMNGVRNVGHNGPAARSVAFLHCHGSLELAWLKTGTKTRRVQKRVCTWWLGVKWDISLQAVPSVYVRTISNGPVWRVATGPRLIKGQYLGHERCHHAK